MKTFRLDNGDIVIGQDGYAAVEGPEKLRQDLAVMLKEPFACDRFHPRWGSMLPEYVGMTADDASALYIRGEISRLLQNYMYTQSDILSKDVAAGRKPRYSRGEVIGDITDIQIQQSFDSFKIKVVLRTLSGEELALVQTVRS